MPRKYQRKFVTTKYSDYAEETSDQRDVAIIAAIEDMNSRKVTNIFW